MGRFSLLLHALISVVSLAQAAAPDPAAALQEKINAAISAKAALVTVDAGTYNFGNRTLLVQDASNLEIRAAGGLDGARRLVSPHRLADCYKTMLLDRPLR